MPPRKPNQSTVTLASLSDAGAAYEQAAISLEAAQSVRDAAILVASAEGLPRRAVARAARVTVGRVQQVISAADGRKKAALADRVLAIAVSRLPEDHRERYHEEWSAEMSAFNDRPLTGLAFALRLVQMTPSMRRALVSGPKTQLASGHSPERPGA